MANSEIFAGYDEIDSRVNLASVAIRPFLGLHAGLHIATFSSIRAMALLLLPITIFIYIDYRENLVGLPGSLTLR